MRNAFRQAITKLPISKYLSDRLDLGSDTISEFPFPMYWLPASESPYDLTRFSVKKRWTDDAHRWRIKLVNTDNERCRLDTFWNPNNPCNRFHSLALRYNSWMSSSTLGFGYLVPVLQSRRIESALRG